MLIAALVGLVAGGLASSRPAETSDSLLRLLDVWAQALQKHVLDPTRRSRGEAILLAARADLLESRDRQLAALAEARVTHATYDATVQDYQAHFDALVEILRIDFARLVAHGFDLRAALTDRELAAVQADVDKAMAKEARRRHGSTAGG